MSQRNEELWARRKKYLRAVLFIFGIPLVAAIVSLVRGGGLKPALVTLPVVVIFFIAFGLQYAKERKSKDDSDSKRE
ncbi:hypothetical protein R69658_08084 [Paraburkholderia aspalathi]|uniref:Uncharacterized protein n=1 Tax=Paraburkholderia aspalathi TaxID=1324617 RepID=A0ABN7NHR1_9BURK|nr:hypothetical protein [Paraburkholderia aspalathi]MBK3824298.1 hypothetical protein [Paraburkholderia aspalathi]MBK3836144.1 hypothetical protein [Paraburkholderia aspalathi]MBK3865911.1 hypothetical protein [Paraburkholderia aspalathi]CAE6864722.1 hypothetical protein R75465_07877 [Paraburkholderia aspalathi]CAE6869851.1 hypothetical protein R69658_08084 [Paraburkholderia aspalathi]